MLSHLLKRLKQTESLTSLNLSVNNLGPTGAEELAEALKTNTTLTNLGLMRNNLGSAGAESLATALETNTSLTHLGWLTIALVLPMLCHLLQRLKQTQL